MDKKILLFTIMTSLFCSPTFGKTKNNQQVACGKRVLLLKSYKTIAAKPHLENITYSGGKGLRRLQHAYNPKARISSQSADNGQQNYL